MIHYRSSIVYVHLQLLEDGVCHAGDDDAGQVRCAFGSVHREDQAGICVAAVRARGKGVDQRKKCSADVTESTLYDRGAST